jgi:hypothetical protein
MSENELGKEGNIMKSFVSKIIKISFVCLLSIMTVISLVQPSSIKAAEEKMTGSIQYYNY